MPVSRQESPRVLSLCSGFCMDRHFCRSCPTTTCPWTDPQNEQSTLSSLWKGVGWNAESKENMPGIPTHQIFQGDLILQKIKKKKIRSDVIEENTCPSSSLAGAEHVSFLFPPPSGDEARSTPTPFAPCP